MEITSQSLRELVDYEAEGENVRAVLGTAMADPVRLVRFFGRYISWNGLFGSGVAALAGKIGRSRELFREEGFPAVVADRSVLVASYFFDAARDEFDDHDTEHRDTHRCLAQANLLGMLAWAQEAKDVAWLGDEAQSAGLFRDPMWLVGLRQRVGVGYGVGTPDDLPAIFRAIGYHLGSEVLADQEFSVIDETMRKEQPDIVSFLEGRSVTLAGQSHLCYQWLRIHSGHGGAAEADHFAWATRGAELAFEYVPRALHEPLREALDDGYREFARDHRTFFDRVDADPVPS